VSADEEVPRVTEVAWLPLEEMTEADLALTPDDGHRYEIVDGSLVVSPAPTAGHQRIAGRLADLLRRHAPVGLDVLEGVGVRAGGQRGSLLIPDVSVVSAEQADRDVTAFDPWHVQLVVEVVSRSSVTMDRLMKPALYAAARIPLYWRIEREHPTGVMIAVHQLDGDSYRLTNDLVGTIEHQLDAPFPVPIRPADLLLPRA
jgi:Uma2 family endonuclease